MLAYGAWFIGKIAALMLDPMTFIFVIPTMLLCGYVWESAWRTSLSAAFAATAVHQLSVWSLWTGLGITDWPQRAAVVFCWYLVVATAAYGLGRLVANIMYYRPPTPSS